MKLLDSEINMLRKYEERFRTAVFSDYSRNIISQDLEQLRLIYNKIHNTDYRLNKSCSTCQLNFLKLLGRWWFDNKENLITVQEKSFTVVEEPEPILKINELENKVTNNEQSTKKCPSIITKKRRKTK